MTPAVHASVAWLTGLSGARRPIGVPFIEVWVRASLDTLQRRDTKGLYARARLGELDGLPGLLALIEAELPLAVTQPGV